jgi:hypothetical protein
MYTSEILGSDGRKLRGPQMLSRLQVLVLRASARAEPKSGSEPSCTSTPSGTDGEDSFDEYYGNRPDGPKCGELVSSRFPTPVDSDNEDDDEVSEDHKRRAALGKRTANRSGRAGGQAIRGKSCSGQMAAGSGSTDKRVTGGHPSKT